MGPRSSHAPAPAAPIAVSGFFAVWGRTNRTVPITNRHDSPWFESFRSHFTLFCSFWLAISEPGWTSPKKFHLESGLNQRDRAKSAASYIKSSVKTTRIFVSWAFTAPRSMMAGQFFPGAGGRLPIRPRHGRVYGGFHSFIASALGMALRRPLGSFWECRSSSSRPVASNRDSAFSSMPSPCGVIGTRH